MIAQERLNFSHNALRHPTSAFAIIMAGRRVLPGGDDLRNIEFETSEDVEVTPTFDSMGIREELLRGIYAYGECLMG